MPNFPTSTFVVRVDIRKIYFDQPISVLISEHEVKKL